MDDLGIWSSWEVDKIETVGGRLGKGDDIGKWTTWKSGWSNPEVTGSNPESLKYLLRTDVTGFYNITSSLNNYF